MNKLVEWEMDELDEFGEEEKSKFKIEDREQLTWAFRKINAIEKSMGENENLANIELERIKEWLKSENGKLENSLEFFKGLILEYAISERSKDKKFKKTVTPYGEVKFRKQQKEYIYDDEKLVGFLEKIGKLDLVKIEKKPLKSDIKKVFKVVGDKLVDDETGEVVEGVVVREREDVIDVKVKKDV